MVLMLSVTNNNQKPKLTMKYFLKLTLLLCGGVVYGQTTTSFISEVINDPIDGRHGYVSNGDIAFHQFESTADSMVVFGIYDSYFCEDYFLEVDFAIMVNGKWVNHYVVLTPYNASEWAYSEFNVGNGFILDLIRGSKYIYKYTDAHCSVERGEGSLTGVTAGFKRLGILGK